MIEEKDRTVKQEKDTVNQKKEAVIQDMDAVRNQHSVCISVFETK